MQDMLKDRSFYLKLYGNCEFPENSHSRKLGEITLFYMQFYLFYIVLGGIYKHKILIDLTSDQNDYILSFTMKITCSEWLYKTYAFNLHCLYSFLEKELNASIFVTNLCSSCIFCDGTHTDAQKNSNISVAHIWKLVYSI